MMKLILNFKSLDKTERILVLLRLPDRISIHRFVVIQTAHTPRICV